MITKIQVSQEVKDKINEAKRMVQEIELFNRKSQKRIAVLLLAIWNAMDKELKYEVKIEFLSVEIGLSKIQINKYLQVAKKNLALLDENQIEQAYKIIQGKKQKPELKEIDKIGKIITTLLNKINSSNGNLTVDDKKELLRKVKEILAILTIKTSKTEVTA